MRMRERETAMILFIVIIHLLEHTQLYERIEMQILFIQDKFKKDKK